MSNTFISKVLAEREILAIVNGRYPEHLQLFGLSSLAIEAWRGKVNLPRKHPLVNALVDLGMLTQTLSNRSNQSFTPLNPNVVPELRQMIGELPVKVALARGEG